MINPPKKPQQRPQEKPKEEAREKPKERPGEAGDLYMAFINHPVEAILDDGRIIRGRLLAASSYAIMIDAEEEGKTRPTIINKAFLRMLTRLG
jgi:small nuclear ribonucleoprotein (snRNP)-like protein